MSRTAGGARFSAVADARPEVRARAGRLPYRADAPERLRAIDVDRLWLGGCISGFLALCWLLRQFVTDDAWITARYAENLAAGQGFAWNPGGPRVEGFSNPLLVAAEAMGHPIGIAG